MFTSSDDAYKRVECRDETVMIFFKDCFNKFCEIGIKKIYQILFFSSSESSDKFCRAKWKKLNVFLNLSLIIVKHDFVTRNNGEIVLNMSQNNHK